MVVLGEYMSLDVVDWNEIWERKLSMNRSSRVTGDCATMWQTREKALEYLKNALDDGEWIDREIASLPIGRKSKVLDIGSGPGILAVPLAKRVEHVTAVEPSDGMMEVLKERIETEGIDNVKCVHKRWEDVSIESDLCPPYDVVIASYSLGMRNILDALSSMDMVASGRVYLYWFAGMNSWEREMKKLWPSLHGREYHPGPKADVLFNVLYSMGICPHVEVNEHERVQRYGSMEDAISKFSDHFGIDTQEKRTLMEQHLREVLEKDGGSFVHRGRSTRVKIWWDANGHDKHTNIEEIE